jgi:hypothetical protein
LCGATYFQGTTSELLKDIVTIFYAPLMQVYKAANISDSLVDLQKFIDDLIRTVERADEGEKIYFRLIILSFFLIINAFSFFFLVQLLCETLRKLFRRLLIWSHGTKERSTTLSIKFIQREPDYLMA